MHRCRSAVGPSDVHAAVGAMSAPTLVRDYLPRAVPLPGNRRRFMHVVERQVMVYRRFWGPLGAGVVGPFLFLGGIGIGGGGLVDTPPGPGGGAHSFAPHVAPGPVPTPAPDGAG